MKNAAPDPHEPSSVAIGYFLADFAEALGAALAAGFDFPPFFSSAFFFLAVSRASAIAQISS
jgi:hypothetical protein